MPISTNLSVELLVDRGHNRVVFAESGKDFVDVLLSFLTLPLATIVRLLGKHSALGSLDKLYASVENLESIYFHSLPCKSMLLRPRSAAWAHCKKLAINLDDSDPEVFYRCRTWSGSSARTCSISPYPNCVCSCGQVMDTMITVFPEVRDGDDGLFVKGPARFMVGDDLRIRPVSMGETLVLFEKLGIKDWNELEKRTVLVGTHEILRLLKRSLVSKTPLTDVFLQEPEENVETEELGARGIFIDRGANCKPTNQFKRINVKLYLSNESNEVVYVEAGEEFMNILFSFLTLPLGLVIKLLGKRSSMGSIDNLYESVEWLSNGNDYMKSDECRNMLLTPKLPPYFGCGTQVFRIDEMQPEEHKIRFNGVPLYKIEMNPKLQNSGLESGSFLKDLVTFMVMDDLVATPLSSISGVHVVNKMMVSAGCLEEAEASLGEAEAVNLLRACLVSRRALSDAFSSNLLTLLEERWSGQISSESV